MKAQRRKNIGRFIVAYPGTCRGKPTFRGTRVTVRDVLSDVERGLASHGTLFVIDGEMGKSPKKQLPKRWAARCRQKALHAVKRPHESNAQRRRAN